MEVLTKKPVRISTITEFNLLISSLRFPFLQQQLDTVSATATLTDNGEPSTTFIMMAFI